MITLQAISSPVTNKFIEDPSLTWGLIIAVIVLAGAIVYLVNWIRWVFAKLITVAENNTAAMNGVVQSSTEIQNAVKDLHSTMNQVLLHLKQ